MPKKLDKGWEPVDPFMGEPEAVALLCERYELPPDDDLYELLESMRLRGSRERLEILDGGTQILTTRKTLDMRKKALDRLVIVVKNVKTFESALTDMYSLIISFEEYGYAPDLMQEIAHGGPGDVWCPAEELHCISALSKLLGPGSEIRLQLEQLKKLPVREKRTRGRMPNLTLQGCVAQCKDYWDGQNRTWKVEALEDSAVRKGNNPSELEGCCERFVCDVLRLAGVDHTLKELRTAMDWASRQTPVR